MPTPMLTVTVGATGERLVRRCLLRRAASRQRVGDVLGARFASVSGSTSTNSSPPKRATKSRGRRGARVERARDALQAIVALNVTVVVVVLLEEIDVDHEQRQRLAACAAPTPTPVASSASKRRRLASAGQAVLERQLFAARAAAAELLLGLLALADVEHEADERLDVAVASRTTCTTSRIQT